MEKEREKVSHYNKYCFGEVKDVMYEVSSYYPQSMSPAISNVLKYIFRAPFKGTPLSDLIKARDYINDAINELNFLLNDKDTDEQNSYIDNVEQFMEKAIIEQTNKII